MPFGLLQKSKPFLADTSTEPLYEAGSWPEPYGLGWQMGKLDTQAGTWVGTREIRVSVVAHRGLCLELLTEGYPERKQVLYREPS